MALINIKDEVRDKINDLIIKERKNNPDLKVNQSYIVEKGIHLLEESL